MENTASKVKPLAEIRMKAPLPKSVRETYDVEEDKEAGRYILYEKGSRGEDTVS